MLYSYSKKCFTGIIILMLILVKTSYAAIVDTTAKAVDKNAGLITGKVVDEDNRPLKDVKITIKGDRASARTDVAGHFEINAVSGNVLEFKYPNHYTSDIVVKNGSDILDIRMLDHYLKSPDKIDILYGTKDQSDELGAISSIYTNQITTTPGPTYYYALPGQLAGLYTQQTSGFTTAQNANVLEAGDFFHNSVSLFNITVNDNTEINISARGQNVTTIIDGIQENIAAIDPASIESISILKDALSTILLGINSSRPVLLVTTKKPEIGAPRITFTTETGIQQSLGLPNDALPSYQYAYLYNEALENDGKAPFYTDADIETYRNHTDLYGHPDINWKNLLLKTYSPLQSDKLNVSGGDDVARYNVSLGYLDQGGIFKQGSGLSYNTNTNISRYTLNTNVSVNVNKNLNVDLQMYGRVQQMFEPGSNYTNLLQQIFTTPNNAYPLYNPDGSFGGSTSFTNNLLSQAEYSGYTQTNIKNVLVNLDLNYNLSGVTKGLTFKGKGNLAIESQVNLNRTQQNQAYAYSISDSVAKYTPVGSSTPLSNYFNTTLSERSSFAQASLDYDRYFGKSRVSGQLLYDTRSLVSNYDLAAVTTDKALKADYSYDGKYLFEGAVNNSSYNRYTPGHQNGWFYAGGIGWQMGKEGFIKNNFAWINSWKWRLTYGKTGDNSNAGYYTYKQTFTTGLFVNTYDFGTTHTGPTSGAAEAMPIANPNLTWEEADKFDIGADITLFDYHFQITADYYHDKYYNLVVATGDPIEILGATYPAQNIGINLYKGGELSLTYKNHINNFNYFITGNGSIEASKRLYFDELPPKYPYNARTGQPVTAIFGYQFIGFYTAADVANHTATLSGYSAQPGDLKYADLNKDGVIDQYDQTAIGGLKPLVFYGGTVGFNYNGFSFSVILQGVFNRQLFVNNSITNGFEGTTASTFGPLAPFGQAYGNIVNRWTPQTASTANYPRLIFDNPNTIFQSSSFFLKSGDYFRIKNAEVGYTLPLSWAQRIKLSSIRVFINAENLVTIAGYKGFPGEDPEVNTPGTYPIQRVINGGLTIKL